eukprot:2453131-Pyramimonas_sp.AAC.1
MEVARHLVLGVPSDLRVRCRLVVHDPIAGARKVPFDEWALGHLISTLRHLHVPQSVIQLHVRQVAQAALQLHLDLADLAELER